MKKINILPYLYDYLSILLEDEDIKKSVKKIILFGSFATGDFDEESDIDIFIEFPKGTDLKKIGNLVKNSEKRFYSVSSRKWELMGINFPVSSILGNLEDQKWKELKEEIISTGITLYGKFEELPKNLKHYHLFNYTLTRLEQGKKMKFLRTLFGYTVKTGKKYRQTGLLEEIGGKKLGPNTILIAVEKSREVHKIFNSFGITPEIREVWIR